MLRNAKVLIEKLIYKRLMYIINKISNRYQKKMVEEAR